MCVGVLVLYAGVATPSEAADNRVGAIVDAFYGGVFGPQAVADGSFRTNTRSCTCLLAQCARVLVCCRLAGAPPRLASVCGNCAPCVVLQCVDSDFWGLRARRSTANHYLRPNGAD
jgi:hypothetical protein